MKKTIMITVETQSPPKLDIPVDATIADLRMAQEALTSEIERRREILADALFSQEDK